MQFHTSPLRGPSPGRASRPACSRSGFTLIELLVVIAIIAILAAILFPVFARARENARRASCQSNQKQIMLGVFQYTQDYDEQYPPTYANIDGKGATYAQIVQPYLKSTQIFQCPSDSTTAATSASYSWATDPPANGIVPHFHTSYMANSQLGGDNTGPFTGTNVGVSIASVQSTATTVYMCDGGSRAGSGTPTPAGNTTIPSSTDKPGAWILTDPAGTRGGDATGGSIYFGGPRMRHLDTTVVAFADGHVKSMRADKFYYNNSDWLNPAKGGS